MAFPPVIPTTTAMREARARRCRCEPESRRPYREFTRGDTLLIPFQVVDRQTGVPIDCTGWTFRLTAKFALANPDAQAAFAADNVPGGAGGLVIAVAAQGQCLATIQPIVTQRWGDGPTGVEYDVQATDGAGIITTIEQGDAVVMPDCTQSIGS